MIDLTNLGYFVYESDDFELKRAWVINRLRKFIEDLEKISRGELQQFLDNNIGFNEVSFIDFIPPKGFTIEDMLLHKLPEEKVDPPEAPPSERDEAFPDGLE